MSTFLITGTAGFIGFHVAQRLLREGHRVVGLDNLNEYYRVQLKHDRHALLEKNDGFTAVKGDLCDLELLTRLTQAHEFDAVCNLAAQAGVRYSIENPHSYLRSNLEGFLNVLEACRHQKVPRLVYASSSSVYGGNDHVPFSESDRVDTPISLYAATKKSNELMAHTYTHLYGLPTVGLRFFTVYGPWGRPDMALWLFTEAMLAGKPIQVFNHGDMMRDFTYIDDIVSGVCASMQVDGLDPYEIFNLGNHRCEKLGDMIDKLSSELGVEPVKTMLPMQPGDVPQTFADIARAQQKLGYSPSTSIDIGIPNFVKWYKEYHQI